MNDTKVAEAIALLLQGIIPQTATGFGAIGPTQEFLDTHIVGAGMTVGEAQALHAAVRQAIKDGNLAKIKKIAEAGLGVIGAVKGLLL